jgi:putative peptidoglycan lipid II flippase
MPSERAATLGRTTGVISSLTMLSRLLGLVREQVFAALLGAGALADAFNVAYRVPNLLRALFAEGALSSAFVPVFKERLKNDGAAGAYRMAAAVLGDLLVLTGIIVAVGALLAPEIVHAMASEFDADEIALSALLTRIMLPFLTLVSLASIAMGMLNAQDRYAAPAAAPAVLNVVSITVAAGLWTAGVSGRWVAIGWAIGTVLGGVAQIGVQLPSLWRLGWRPRLRLDLWLRDPAVRRVAIIMAPAVVAIAAVQVNVFLNTFFATSEEGAVSWLNYAFRFLQLPIGVFGVAIGTVSTTRYADAAADGDPRTMAAHLVEGMKLLFFLTVPATIGLVVLDDQIIRFLFERGRFNALDTAQVSAALDLFAIGLVAFAAIKVIAPAFYAAGKVRLAVGASLVGVAVNVIANLLLHDDYGFRILALNTSLAAIINAALLYAAFHVWIARLPHLALLWHFLRVTAAAGAMGAVVHVSRLGIDRVLGTDGLIARASAALLPVVVGVIAFALACMLLRVEELERFTSKLRRSR